MDDIFTDAEKKLFAENGFVQATPYLWEKPGNWIFKSNGEFIAQTLWAQATFKILLPAIVFCEGE